MTKAARRAKITHASPSAHGAVALRGALALDLINTEMMDRGKQRDTLSSPDALARWWEAVCKRNPDQCVIEGADEAIDWTSELLDAVLELRRALRTLITQVVESGVVEEEDSSRSMRSWRWAIPRLKERAGKRQSGHAAT